MKRWELLENDEDFHNIFESKPLIAYARSRNLQEHLKMTTKPSNTDHKGMRKCNNCVHCNNVMQQDFVTHPRTGEKTKLKFTADCNSNFVLYCIKCPCGLMYIGKTERKLKIRIGEHKSMIRNKNMKSNLAAHWITHNHNISQVRFMAVEKIEKREGTDSQKLLSQREVMLIKKFQTVEPMGLNDKLDLVCFL